MKLDKVNFVPVLNGSILNCALREDLNLNGKRMTFYTKDAISSYCKFLINPYHHSDIWQKIKEKGLIPDDATKEEEATLLSLYRKKILNKREMVDGVETTRSLTPEEADVLYTVIKNPGAFK